MFRIQAILRASASDNPMSKATMEFLTEPSFLSSLQTNDWFSLAVNLHNIIDLCAARKLDSLCGTYPQPRSFAKPAKHLKLYQAFLGRFNMTCGFPIRITNVALKFLGLEPRADSLVQNVLTPGVTDLTFFSSYDQLMEQLETRINTARAIYNVFQRPE